MARSPQLLDLRHDVCTSVNRNGLNAVELFGKKLNLLGDLLTQFAGWCEDQGLDMRGFGVQVFEHGQPKCSCFARSRLCQANEIPIPCEQVRDGFLLNFGGVLKAKCGDCFEKRGGKPKTFK